jgi:hypothetical protein
VPASRSSDTPTFSPRRLALDCLEHRADATSVQWCALRPVRALSSLANVVSVVTSGQAAERVDGRRIGFTAQMRRPDARAVGSSATRSATFPSGLADGGRSVSSLRRHDDARDPTNARNAQVNLLARLLATDRKRSQVAARDIMRRRKRLDERRCVATSDSIAVGPFQ